MVVVDKKKFGSWAQGSRFYEQQRIMDDTSYSGSWAYNFGFYEEFKVLHDMNDSRFHELDL